MTTKANTRRSFLGSVGMLGGLAMHWPVQGAEQPGAISIGLVADVHKDLVPDADARLTSFIAQAKERRPDFVIQMGDFCTPKPVNRDFLKIWESFAGPRYHVLGNHDVDGGFTWAQTMAYYGMAKAYYSFDVKGCHFVVLDGNERAPKPAPGYPRYISPKQLEWLAADLAATQKPTVVFSHQSLENPGGVTNAAEVRTVLERANADAARRKVVACLSGHHHIDYATTINDIAYVQINSMSYYWVGDKYPHARFDAATEKAFPYMRFTVPYRDSLFAFLTIDQAAGELRLEGRASAYVLPDPKGLGMPERPENDRPSPLISDRRLKL